MSRKPDRERAGARVVLVMLLVLVVLLGGGYVAAYANAQDKTPRGTRVAGVNVGGRTVFQAAQALRAGLKTLANAPITLDIGTTTQEISPAEAGLGIDYVASVQQAGAGRSWNPDWLWNYYTGGQRLRPVVTVSAMTMSDFVTQLAASVGTQARDGRVGFGDQGVTIVKPRPGRTIDPRQAQAAITAAYLSDDPTAHIDLVSSAPGIDDADVRAAVQGFANPAISGSVTLDFDGRKVRLQPRDFASTLSLRPVDGKLKPHVDGKRLVELVEQAMPGHGDPVDATVALIGGRPEVVPARPGVSFQAPEVVAAFTAALTLPEGQREAAVSAQERRPKFSTQDARHLKIRHRVGTFTTTYAAADAGADLTRAVTLIDGTLLMPGDTFSFADVAGTGYGPDVLAVSTALFNAAFEAGFTDVEHHAPATYAGRSPVGRQATVADGQDLRFAPDSPYGVMVQARLTPASPGHPGTVHVTLWSTAVWEVTVSTSARSNVVEPTAQESSDPGCVPYAGRRGFDVDVTRHLHDPADPTRDHDEVVHTTYAPVDAVVCTAA